MSLSKEERIARHKRFLQANWNAVGGLCVGAFPEARALRLALVKTSVIIVFPATA